jgi:PAS domain S-box-containing protein
MAGQTGSLSCRGGRADARPLALRHRHSVRRGALVWAGFTVSVAIVLIVGAVAYHATAELAQSSTRVVDSYLVIEKLRGVLHRLIRAQDYNLLYFTTGDAQFRDRPSRTRREVEQALATLARLTAGNHAQEARIAAILPGARARLAQLTAAARAGEAHGPAAGLDYLRAHDPRPVMTDLSQRIADAIGAEETLLAGRRAREAATVRLSERIIGLGSLAALLAVGFAGVFIQRILLDLRINTQVAEQAAAEARARGTELEHQVEVVRRGEQRFRNLLEVAPDAILVVDASGAITYANARTREFFGYQPGELLGSNVDLLIPSRNRGGHSGNRATYAREPRVRHMAPGRQLTALRKDGSEFPVEISLSPIETEEGLLVLTMIRDISERNRAERELRARTEELARSNAELEQFAYIASHDLQEPLRMVASYLQLVAQRYKGRLDADADDFINFAVDGATRMKQLINDLLNFSRAGRQIELEPVALDRVLARSLGTLALRIRETGARVTSDPLPRVIGDEARLYELFLNLIGNALKFRSANPPVVQISARRDRAQWDIAVRDNGIGIAPEYQERIFAMFQRLHGRDEYPGTGIGLAICKRIVELHGGSIWVDSQPGQGATFSFTLPAAPEGNQVAEQRHEAADGRNPASRG